MQLNRPVYLDYNATTPLDPAVVEAMMPFFRESFGNPSSGTHSYGWDAKIAVENARTAAARMIGAIDVHSIIWTSGATESNNLAIQGILNPFIAKNERAHFITTQTEHKAVLDVARYLERHHEKNGLEVTYIKPDSYGQVSAESVCSAIRPHTRLISIIHANNEIGTVNPVAAIAAEVRKKNIMLHVDAAQSAGKIPLDVEKYGIDLLSVSGHKIYGPKGVGFLYAHPSVLKSGRLSPLFFGGSQERGLRPGTLNVAGIVGLGRACELCYSTMPSESARLCQMRDKFIAEVLQSVPSVQLNGHPTERVFSNISLSFKGLSSDVFASLGVSQIAVSSGSACSTGEPSHVLAAIGLPEDLARATLRIGIGRFTTPQDLDVALAQIQVLARHLENV